MLRVNKHLVLDIDDRGEQVFGVEYSLVLGMNKYLVWNLD